MDTPREQNTVQEVAKCNDSAMVCLLARHVKVDLQTLMRAFWDAARDGQLEVVCELAHYFSYRDRDVYLSAFMEALKNKHFEIMRALTPFFDARGLGEILFRSIGKGSPEAVKMLLNLDGTNTPKATCFELSRAASFVTERRIQSGSLYYDAPIFLADESRRIKKREKYLEIVSLLAAQPGCNLFFGDPAIQDSEMRKANVGKNRASLFAYRYLEEADGREEIKIAAISDHFQHHFPAALVLLICASFCPDLRMSMVSKIFDLVCNEFKPNPALNPASEFNNIRKGVLDKLGEDRSDVSLDISHAHPAR